MTGMAKAIGYVYLIHHQGTDQYKIGRTTDLKNRLSQLQTGCPGVLYFKHFIALPGCDVSKAEAYLHRQWVEQRIRTNGEWFRLGFFDVPAVVQDMERIASRYQPQKTHKRFLSKVIALVAAALLVGFLGSSITRTFLVPQSTVQFRR
jgi:hypothetical protein